MPLKFFPGGGFFALVLSVLLPCIGHAENPKEVDSYAVVDTLTVLNEAVVYRSFQDQFFKELQGDQRYILEAEKHFRDEDQQFLQELESRRIKKKPMAESSDYTDVLMARRRRYEEEVAMFQELILRRKEYLDNKFHEVKTLIQKTIVETVRILAEKNNFTIVLHRSQMLYVKPKRDITEQVMQDVNKRLPTIKIHIDSIEEFKKTIIGKEKESANND